MSGRSVGYRGKHKSKHKHAEGHKKGSEGGGDGEPPEGWERGDDGMLYSSAEGGAALGALSPKQRRKKEWKAARQGGPSGQDPGAEERPGTSESLRIATPDGETIDERKATFRKMQEKKARIRRGGKSRLLCAFLHC